MNNRLSEDEMQRFSYENAKKAAYVNLREIIVKQKPGHTHDQEITLLDFVSFARKYFSVPKFVYYLIQQYDPRAEAFIDIAYFMMMYF